MSKESFMVLRLQLTSSMNSENYKQKSGWEIGEEERSGVLMVEYNHFWLAGKEKKESPGVEVVRTVCDGLQAMW